MKIKSSDIPQADQLSKVVMTVKSVVRSGSIVHDKRDRDYYRLAAVILGFLNSDFSLTESGKQRT